MELEQLSDSVQICQKGLDSKQTAINVVLEDAADFVQRVMCSQPASVVIDTSKSSRKRVLSAPSLENIENDNKKVKTLHFGDTEVTSCATESPPGELHVADIHVPIIETPEFDDLNLSDLARMIYSMTCDMKVMSNNMHRLNTDVHDMIAGVHKRIDSVQQTIEQSVTKKLSNSLDKRISTEINKMKKHVDDKVDGIIREVQRECTSNIEESQKNIEELMQNLDLHNPKSTDIFNNIVLVNIKESRNENVLDKVNTFLEDVIHVSVRAIRAERKGAEGARVIIATMKSQEDKSEVLKQKSCLRRNKQYSNVFISSDRSREERVQANNFRKILDSLKAGEVSNLEMRGAHIVSKSDVRDHSRHNHNGANSDVRDHSRHNHNGANSDVRDPSRHNHNGANSDVRDHSRQNGANRDSHTSNGNSGSTYNRPRSRSRSPGTGRH